jgi:DNA-binding phage protein
MDSYVDQVHPEQERGLVEAVKRWKASLSADRLRALGECLESKMTKRKERQLIQALRKAIEQDGRSINAIAIDAGLSASVVWRFVQAQRGMGIEAAAALAETLGLELRPKCKRGV